MAADEEGDLNVQLLELSTNTVLADFTEYDFTPRFVDAASQSYRRGDRELVTNDSPAYKAELTFEFQRLTQAQVDALQAIYRGRDPFICIPEPLDAPERVYVVRWASGFGWQDTVITNWTQGKSLQTVFREI